MNRPAQPGIPLTHLTSLREWLANGDHVPRLWLGRYSVLVAWMGLGLAAMTPPTGFGFSICWWQESIGLPCPGCGVTRSLSCAVRGLFTESLQYHPFGLAILTLFFATAIWSLLPIQRKIDVKAFLSRRPLLFNSTYLVFVTGFVSFGFLRSLHHWIIRCW